MRQRLSTRTLCILAVCLATLSAAVSWRSAARYTRVAETCEREITLIESEQAELNHNLLGLGALVQKVNEDLPGSERVSPTDPRVVQWCERIKSDVPRFEVFETVRADIFLLWYHKEMKKLHPSEPRGDSVLVARNSTSD